MQKTKIEWADYSWNPIKGRCPKNCWYCYATKMYDRFKWGDFLRIDYKELDCAMPKKPSRIFVGSTIELFHEKIDEHWRSIIFDRIRRYPEHDFIILTKKPDYIDKELPENVWLGVTITTQKDIWRWDYIQWKSQPRIRFISYEPLIGRITAPPGPGRPADSGPDWVIIGRMTGQGHDLDPRLDWVLELVKYYQDLKTPVFIKDNLFDIWGTPIREFPDPKRKDRIEPQWEWGR